MNSNEIGTAITANANVAGVVNARARPLLEDAIPIARISPNVTIQLAQYPTVPTPYSTGLFAVTMLARPGSVIPTTRCNTIIDPG
ncbi:hypothetical protein ACFROC_18890 [Nocardia tengchongensis]|uniref:hypothetical protein n=1 Tax=Nocardia tengchongensis TaxID=2055889 RepID=UPI003697A359